MIALKDLRLLVVMDTSKGLILEDLDYANEKGFATQQGAQSGCDSIFGKL